MKKKYRLITRSDFDGLVCALILKDLDLIDEIKFAHPKDMQDGAIEVTERDITANLPYVESAHLVFDHHDSEIKRVGSKKENHIIDPFAPSAARAIYNYYGGMIRLAHISEELLDAVDKADFAQFSIDEVLNPKGWNLLSFIMDSRTGLGRFKDFRISNYKLMMDLIDYCRDHTVDEILELRDVKERVDLYFEYVEKFKDQINTNSKLHGEILVIDFRDQEVIFPGNRFIEYALYPEATISIRMMRGLNNQNTVLAVGRSIFNKNNRSNIGELMLEYDGGGHKNAGTCQVGHEKSIDVLHELIERLQSH